MTADAFLPGFLEFARPPDTKSVDVPGMSLLADFITETQERELLSVIDQQPWRADLQRRVQHYGYQYDYTARQVTADLYLVALNQ